MKKVLRGIGFGFAALLLILAIVGVYASVVGTRVRMRGQELVAENSVRRINEAEAT